MASRSAACSAWIPRVHEDGAADRRQDLLRSQPAAVGAARSERLDVLDVSRRMRRHPLVAALDCLATLALPRRNARVVGVGALASILRALVGERRVGLGRDVAELGQQVHHLVVAEQRLDPAAGAPGFVLEAHQEIERRPDARAAVEDVAGLHQDGVAAAPAPRAVDQPRRLKDADELVEGAVDVTDGDDPRAGRRRSLGRGGAAAAPLRHQPGDDHEGCQNGRGKGPPGQPQRPIPREHAPIIPPGEA